ncbi:MAG: hypothetical protein P1U85_05745 [Verrucomicrobiales bacterium]|jgi:hypothetical protein|nr:hypothetical protein [Verrucomicrobiales bacterium]
MIPEPQTAEEAFLYEWGLNLGTWGAICVVFGLFAGWIIWRNTRRLAEKVESGNREAFAEYENTSDEVSKIKAELHPRR